jgi:hypothetical protein
VSVTISCIGILVETLIVFRGLQGKLLRRFPFFYAYIISTWAFDVPLYVLYSVGSPLYARWFWTVQFVTLVLGYGILLEIFTHVLSPYSGAERFARRIGLIILGAIFVFAFVYPHLFPQTSVSTSFELERDFRTIQAILLFGIVGVISYYGITVGKNMKGMILGYGLYIGTTLIGLAARSYAGPHLYAVWNVVPPFSYDVSLCIWMIALWSYHPNPVPEVSVRIEEDYEAFVARTRSVLGAMRSHLAKAVRP